LFEDQQYNNLVKMKTVKNVLIGALVVLLSSCATTIKFPTSNTAPAADITVTKKQDKNKNFVIEVTAKNLASPDRLTPSKSNYSVWIVTENSGTKNIGQLKNKNAKTATLKTSTPFDFKEIFITAEDGGANSYPSSFEISRTSLNK